MSRRGLTALVLLLCLVVVPAAGQEAAGGAMSLAELDDEIAQREADLRRYSARLERLEADTTEVGAELEIRGAELRAQEGQVRARIVTLCRLRQGGYLHLLRGAGSLSDLVRRARYARALTSHDLALLRQHQGRVEELRARREELDGRLAEQRELRGRIEGYRDELAAERQRRAAVVPAAAGFGYDPAAASFEPGGFPRGTLIDL